MALKSCEESFIVCLEKLANRKELLHDHILRNILRNENLLRFNLILTEQHTKQKTFTIIWLVILKNAQQVMQRFFTVRFL